MSEYLFNEAHQWLRVEGGGDVTVGLSDFAQAELGEVVFVELPEPGTVVRRGAALAMVETLDDAVEAVSPVTGTVMLANARLGDEPGLLNDDPAGDGWLLRVRLADDDELVGLMPEEEYENFVASLG